jgi:hypothetical protein
MGKNIYIKCESHYIMRLSKDKNALISIQDYERVKEYQWHISDGYATRRYYENGTYKNLRLHRYIMEQTDTDSIIDHINRNRLDDRRENLRIADSQLNSINRDKLKSNTSGMVGVQQRKWRDGTIVWRPTININAKPVKLGTFKTADEALQVRREAELKYYGQYVV